MFVKINKCVNYVHKSSILFDWILKINIPFSVEMRIILYVIVQNIFSHAYEHVHHFKLVELLTNVQLHIAKIFGIVLNITYNIHGFFPEKLDYSISVQNTSAFIECSSTLHPESFNKVLYSIRRLSEIIRKLHIKKPLSNYKYDNKNNK